MRSMNSRWAGGWNRRFIFAAMRYSRIVIDSSFGRSIDTRAVVRKGRDEAGARRTVAAALRRRKRPVAIVLCAAAALLAAVGRCG